MIGVKAENAVNVSRIRATGERVLSSMTGVSKGSEQPVSLALKSATSATPVLAAFHCLQQL